MLKQRDNILQKSYVNKLGLLAVDSGLGEFLNQQGLQEAIQGEVDALKAEAEVEILI
jgi:hypothetical protein